MSDASKRFDKQLRSVIEKNPILPVKVNGGILVGTVLIVSEGHLKHLWKNSKLVYKEISLNKVAIKLANMLAKHGKTVDSDKIYKLDQDYGHWFIDSQILRSTYQTAVKNKDYVRADVMWARYTESRDRTNAAKSRLESLIDL